MIVYNVTVKVDNTILKDWLIWIEKHMPEVVNTGCFVSSSFFELLDPKTDVNRTFVIQYFAENMKEYEKYVSDFAPKLREDGMQKFGDNFVAFRSILQKMD